MRRMHFTWMFFLIIFCSVISGCNDREKEHSSQVVNSANISQSQIIQQPNDITDKEKKADWEKAMNTKGKYTDLSHHDKPLP